MADKYLCKLALIYERKPYICKEWEPRSLMGLAEFVLWLRIIAVAWNEVRPKEI